MTLEEEIKVSLAFDYEDVDVEDKIKAMKVLVGKLADGETYKTIDRTVPMGDKKRVYLDVILVPDSDDDLNRIKTKVFKGAEQSSHMVPGYPKIYYSAISIIPEPVSEVVD